MKRSLGVLGTVQRVEIRKTPTLRKIRLFAKNRGVSDAGVAEAYPGYLTKTIKYNLTPFQKIRRALTR